MKEDFTKISKDIKKELLNQLAFEETNDIDILVVSDDFNRRDIFERSKMTRGIHLAMVKKFNKPFDLLYVSTDERNNKKLLIEV